MTNTLAKVIPLTTFDGADPRKWIGRIAVFEVITGSRIQGKIIAFNEQWIDTDGGTIRIEHIVCARWVGPEEEQIIRGGPLGSYGYQLSRK